jgi:hypothetical protein
MSVWAAYTSGLLRLDVDELPADLRAPFQGVINALTRDRLSRELAAADR